MHYNANLCRENCAVGVRNSLTILFSLSIHSQIGAEDTHDCGNTVKSCFATSCLLCGLICCYDHIFPCYLSSLLDRSMQFHKISVFPTPCGDAKFPICGCYWQMCCQCTSSCTLCVLYREANHAEQGGFTPANPPK